jgi:rhamnosyltransferase
MNISILIPTLNASNLLPELLVSLNRQTIKDKEIIIIDSSSTDNTVEIAESYDVQVIGIERKDFDHGGTRNLAASRARGETLVYITQDAEPASDHSLENLLRPFSEDRQVAAIFGRQLPRLDASPLSAHLRLFNYPDSSYVRCREDRSKYGFKTIFLSNSYSAYRKSALEKIGGFKENLIFGEDSHAAARLLCAGHKLAYRADAMVYHSHNYSSSQDFKRYFDMGVFHKREDWLVREFGRTGKEGKKYIKSEISYLLKYKKYNYIPLSLFRNLLKFLGYNLGLKYSHIPGKLAPKLSMNKNWWERS